MTGKTKLQSVTLFLLFTLGGLFYALRPLPAESSPASGPVGTEIPAAAPNHAVPAKEAGGNPPSSAQASPASGTSLNSIPSSSSSVLLPPAPRKVGTVDMSRVFNEYYKTKDVERKLNEDKSRAKKEMDARTEKYKELLARLAQIEKVLKDKLVSEQLKQQQQREGRALMEEANTMARAIQEFVGRRERQLQDQSDRMRKVLVEDILVQLREMAKRDNYDWVFDKSGLGAGGTLALPFSRDALDFSSEVIAGLNRNAPPPPPPAGTRPVP